MILVCEPFCCQRRLQQTCCALPIFEDDIGIILGKLDLLWVDIQSEASFHPAMEGKNHVLDARFNRKIILKSLFQALESVFNVLFCDLEGPRKIAHEQVPCKALGFIGIQHATGLNAHPNFTWRALIARVNTRQSGAWQPSVRGFISTHWNDTFRSPRLIIIINGTVLISCSSCCCCPLGIAPAGQASGFWPSRGSLWKTSSDGRSRSGGGHVGWFMTCVANPQTKGDCRVGTHGHTNANRWQQKFVFTNTPMTDTTQCCH